MIVIRIKNNKGKIVARFKVYDTAIGMRIPENEMEHCTMYDVDCYANEEATYTIQVSECDEVIENLSNEVLINELSNRLAKGE